MSSIVIAMLRGAEGRLGPSCTASKSRGVRHTDAVDRLRVSRSLNTRSTARAHWLLCSSDQAPIRLRYGIGVVAVVSLACDLHLLLGSNLGGIAFNFVNVDTACARPTTVSLKDCKIRSDRI